MFKSRNIRWLFVVLAVFVLASAVYAFAASNTVPTSKVGDGSGTITGYVISNISYSPKSDDISKLDKVTFTLDSAASTVKVKFSSSGSWYTCTIAGNVNVTCTMGGAVNVIDASSLEVVAIQ
jgi:hypothetical protein